MRNIQTSNRSRRLKVSAAQVRALFRCLDEVLENDSIPDGDLSIVFLDRPQMCQLHEDFLMDPTHTDVITFPGDIEMDFAGEICVSVDFAVENARDYNQSFEKELTLYLVHGWLHLAGYDDKAEDKRAEMRKAEARTMDVVERAGKIPRFQFI